MDVVIDKLALYGWTLPAELSIYDVNVIGQTNDIEDINKFLLCFFAITIMTVLSICCKQAVKESSTGIKGGY